jgi:lysophospholipase L1-like esterase
MNIAFFGDSLTQGTIGASYFNRLEKKLPKHTLFNYGQNGDTVRSLLNRMKKIDFTQRYDISFVWVGTNDILVHVSWAFPPMKLLLNQPWTPTCESFTVCYQQLLEFLQPHTENIITVSPLFIGEDFTNSWNQQLATLGKTIKNLSVKFHAHYLDIQKIIQHHQKSNPSLFIQKKVTGTIIDSLLYSTPEKIDQRAQQRHLRYTIDGIHLNNKGAELVADVFYTLIKKY